MNLSKEALQLLGDGGHEQVTVYQNHQLHAVLIVAIHATIPGPNGSVKPSLGGLRWWPYTIEEGLFDALRLSRYMTLKWLHAWWPSQSDPERSPPFGGGKAVLIAPPDADPQELFSWVGTCVEACGGSYVTAEDVGTSVEFCDIIRRKTSHVGGRATQTGDPDGGDPSPSTALGVMYSMDALLARLGMKYESQIFIVEGVGKTGRPIVEMLLERGAGKVKVTDVNEDALSALCKRHPEVQVIRPDQTLRTAGSVYVPCAMGNRLTPTVAKDLPRGWKVVCGSANILVWDEARTGRALESRGITLAPDSVVNAGGIIKVHDVLEHRRFSARRLDLALRRIPEQLERVLSYAESRGLPPGVAMIEMAEERLAELRLQASTV